MQIRGRLESGGLVRVGLRDQVSWLGLESGGWVRVGLRGEVGKVLSAVLQ